MKTNEMKGSIAAAAVVVIVVLVIGGCGVAIEQGPPLADSNGVVYSGETLEDGTSVFRGVPYAQPPLGALRWRPPQPLELESSPFLATEFAPACPQNDRLSVFYGRIVSAFDGSEEDVQHLGRSSENCLYLNIWTPDIEADAPLPVMVWLHGGSNTSGWSSEVAYDGADLASRGAVVVSINYRVGPLGFFSHPALSAENESGASGNYGLMDQAFALTWVRRHIGAFGGDPERVTVFGESAGSSDIVHLMASDRSKHLFDGAIAQSGAPMGGTTSLEAAERNGVALLEELGVANPESADALAELRAMPAGALIEAIDGTDAGITGSVVIDGAFLTESAGDAFQAGRQAEVPLMIGSNANEFSTLAYYLPEFERTKLGYEEWARSTYFFFADRILSLYPVERDDDVEPALVRLVTDLVFTCPARTAARRHARAGHPTYRYYFTRVSPGPGGEALGAYHGMEVPYVFNTRFDWLPTEEADLALAAAMGAYWVEFASSGDPNRDGLSEWPVYVPSDDGFLELGESISAGSGVQTPQCDFLDQVLRTGD